MPRDHAPAGDHPLPRRPATGPPVVFVHGLLVDGELWRKVTPPAARATPAASRPTCRSGSHTHRDERRRGPHAGRRRAAGRRLPRAALDLEDVTLVGNDTGGAISQLARHSTTASGSAGWCSPTATASRTSRPRCSRRWSRRRACPGALYAAVQPMRSAAARRSPLAYGWLAHESPTRSPSAWVAAVARATPASAATSRPSARDRQGDDARRRRAPAVARQSRSLVAWAPGRSFFPPELGRRLAAVIPAPASSRSRARARSCRGRGPTRSPT